MSEVDAGGLAKELENEAEARVFRRGQFGGDIADQIGVASDAGELAGNRFGRKNIVDDTGVDSAAGHAVIFCGFLVLGESDAAMSLNFG